MKFKIASVILVLFSLIGGGMLLSLTFNSTVETFIVFILYVLIPAYGAYGLLKGKRKAVLMAIFLFAHQSVRPVNNDDLIPDIAPITVSFSMGDFQSGQGYLVDLFAIFMVLLLVWLFRSMVNKNIPD